MKLPYILQSFYRFAADHTPETVKPTLRGLYNMGNKAATYGRTDIFIALDLEINSRCNLKCSYCPISTESRGDEFMEEALFLKIMEDLSSFPYAGRISPHFYGEPTIDTRLVHLMRLARKMVPKAELIIHTNGTHLDRALYRDLLSAGVTGFLVTRHTPKWPKGILDIMTNEPNAAKTMKVRDLEQATLFNRGGTVKPKRPRTLRSCFYLSDEIAITHNGEVVCTNDFHITESFGNVRNSHLLNDIWWGEEFSNLRKELRSGQFRLPVCKVCSAGVKKTSTPELVQIRDHISPPLPI